MKAKSGRVRFAEVDLDEDGDVGMPQGSEHSGEDEDEVDDQGDEFIDILDVLDGKGEVDNGSDEENTHPSLKHGQKSNSRDQELDGEDEEDESAVSDDEESLSAVSENSEASPGALEELGTFLSALDPGKKRKAPPPHSDGLPVAEGRPRKKRLIQERTEAGPESEFRAQASGVWKTPHINAGH